MLTVLAVYHLRIFFARVDFHSTAQKRTAMVHRRTAVIDKPSHSPWLSPRVQKSVLCLCN